jgi:hypothetical protein
LQIAGAEWATIRLKEQQDKCSIQPKGDHHPPFCFRTDLAEGPVNRTIRSSAELERKYRNYEDAKQDNAGVRRGRTIKLGQRTPHGRSIGMIEKVFK